MHDPIRAFQMAMIAALGYAPDTVEPGRMHRFATREQRGDSSGWCKLFDDLRGGVFGCHRQGINQTWSAFDRATMTREERAALARGVMAATAERMAEQRQQWATNARRNADVWRQCVPLVPGDPVSLYIKRRLASPAWPLPQALRFHPALAYWHEGKCIGLYPAMVAPLTAPDCRMLALHRTLLTRDGRKADVLTPKKLTATAGPLAGAGIALMKPENGVIGVAEGIETALAAWLASGVATVATYCAGSLGAWQWPAGVRRIVVFADADKAGRQAADALRARAFAAGLRCEVMTPTEPGADWCDVWAARGAVLIEAGGAA